MIAKIGGLVLLSCAFVASVARIVQICGAVGAGAVANYAGAGLVSMCAAFALAELCSGAKR